MRFVEAMKIYALSYNIIVLLSPIKIVRSFSFFSAFLSLDIYPRQWLNFHKEEPQERAISSYLEIESHISHYHKKKTDRPSKRSVSSVTF